MTGSRYRRRVVTVRRIDPAGLDMDRWHACYLAGHVVDDPDEPEWLLPELRARAVTQLDERYELYVAKDSRNDVVGALSCAVPVHDNRHMMIIEHLSVLPQRRRGGIGTRLLAQAARVAAHHARSTMLTEALAPGSLDHDVAADHAARAWGFALASRDQRRTLAVPLAEEVTGRVRAAIGRRADAYDVVTWSGPAPVEYLQDRALIQQRMSTDTPLGDIDWRAESWDAARFRRLEQSIAAMGRHSWTAGAVQRSTGRLVAATWLLGHPDHPHQAWQWDTLVLPEHRGHRLGLRVKLANLDYIQRERPATRLVSTSNATDNAPMIAVNEALGFELSGHWREYQRREVTR